MAIDGNKLQDLIGKMMGDVGAAMGTALVMIGDKLGFYKMLAAAGPLTSAELASKTGAGEARLRDLLIAGGFSRVRRATATPFNLLLEARP